MIYDLLIAFIVSMTILGTLIPVVCQSPARRRN